MLGREILLKTRKKRTKFGLAKVEALELKVKLDLSGGTPEHGGEGGRSPVLKEGG